MKLYRLTMTIEDEIEAEDMDAAWETFKARVEDRFYGPTKDHIEVGEEVGEAEEEGE